MCNFEEKPMCLEKLDNVSEYMEELILDAMLAALRKIKERNELFNNISKSYDGQATAAEQDGDYPF